jgi:hypothetical protein
MLQITRIIDKTFVAVKLYDSSTGDDIHENIYENYGWGWGGVS